jgi:L-aspartate oxidase
LASKGAELVEDVLLNSAQTDFSKNEDGSLHFTKEAAHPIARIIHKDDKTGQSIQISLLNLLSNKSRYPQIEIKSSHVAIDLITPSHHGVRLQQRYEKEQVVGVYALDIEQDEVIKIMAKKVVLATGGIGALYLHHTNSHGARGDGHAMAMRAGALITDMEFIQFHPTTFFDSSGHRRFLISEAVRGEGGILINSSGNAFMEKYHPLKELAPRDIVARAIVDEMIVSNHECVYLDMSHKDQSWLQKRFPTIYANCLEKKIDMGKDPIPVVPAAHYSCGGIKTDLTGATTLSNLYAVGEVACTGLHGANRLASTSLLEGLVMGTECGAHIAKELYESVLYESTQIKDWIKAQGECDGTLLQQDWTALKQTMWNYVGITRSRRKLRRAGFMLDELSKEVAGFYRNARLEDKLIGLRNAITIARLVQDSSYRNKESRGCFYRED